MSNEWARLPRRDALAWLAAGGSGIACAGTSSSALQPQAQAGKLATTHFITLSFDDGFSRSVQQVAKIYEAHGLKACINVIATGHLPEFVGPDSGYIKPGSLGDFSLWNALRARGHEIMPHGYKHARKTELPLAEAQALIEKCLQYFTDHLDGFHAQDAIFNFPFNASSPELESWLAPRVRAFRTASTTHSSPWNPFPVATHPKLMCKGKGPENIDRFLKEQVDAFLAGPAGWFIFNTHGVDGEGWGPVSSAFLDQLLGELTALPHVAVLPVGAVLDRSDAVRAGRA